MSTATTVVIPEVPGHANHAWLHWDNDGHWKITSHSSETHAGAPEDENLAAEPLACDPAFGSRTQADFRVAYSCHGVWVFGTPTELDDEVVIGWTGGSDHRSPEPPAVPTRDGAELFWDNDDRWAIVFGNRTDEQELLFETPGFGHVVAASTTVGRAQNGTWLWLCPACNGSRPSADGMLSLCSECKAAGDAWRESGLAF